MTVNTYKDLIVWQKSIDLTVGIYTLTDKFPSKKLNYSEVNALLEEVMKMLNKMITSLEPRA